MANNKHLSVLCEGVKSWNEWRRANPTISPDLSSVNLQRTSLYLSDIDLSSAKWAFLFHREWGGEIFGGEPIFEGGVLSGADFSNTNLSGTNFYGTDLIEATLSGANLKGAHLVRTNFSGANLTKASLEDTLLSKTIFIDTNLTDAKGLDACVHNGPSTIDHRTLAKSGNIPKEFLRGCGLPDFIINDSAVLRGELSKYYSCFISYSHKDELFAKQLYVNLQDNGVRCWFAPEDIKGGHKIHLQINEAVRTHDKLILILSEHSMQSNWVNHEIRRARYRERCEGRQTLFPISLVRFDRIREWELFEADEGRDLAAEIREYYIPDFSKWEEGDMYQQTFKRLLRDLTSNDILS